MIPDVKQGRGKIVFSLYLPFIKNRPKNEGKWVRFFLILGFKTGFYEFSHVTSWVRPDFTLIFGRKCRVGDFKQVL